MRVELQFANGPQLGQVILPDESKFLIGREVDCHLRPSSPLVSRHHCVLQFDDFTARVRDLGSRNGTFVNGEPVQGERILKDGDTLVVGDTALLVTLANERGSEGVEPPQPVSEQATVFEGETLPASDSTVRFELPPPEDVAPSTDRDDESDSGDES